MSAKITMTVEAGTPAELRNAIREILNEGPRTVTVNVNAPADAPGQDPDRFARTPEATAAAVVEAKEAPPAKEEKPPAKKEKVAKSKAEKAAHASGVDQPKSEPAPAPPEPEATATEPAKADEPTPPEVALHVDVPELPADVQGTSSMRDLLSWLADKGGVTSVDRMVEVCVALKPTVPILQKVPDVDQRVRRAAEVLGLFASDQPA